MLVEYGAQAPWDKSEGEIWFLRKLVDLLLRVLSGLVARGAAIRVRKQRSACVRQGSLRV